MSQFQTNSIFKDLLTSNPISYLDIGTTGLSERWQSISPFLSVIAFDAEEAGSRKYGSTPLERIRFLNAALYKEMGEVDYYWCQAQQVSSLYEPNLDFLKNFPRSDRFQIKEIKRISVDTLDHQLHSADVRNADFIRLNTEGCELEILKGGVETLRKCFALKTEVSFAPLRKSQAKFGEICDFMEKHQFQLFDLSRIYWKREHQYRNDAHKGQLVMGDALFLKQIEHLCPESSSPQTIKIIVTKALAIALLYKYHDYAKAIFDHYENNFEQAEKVLLQKWIQPKKSYFNQTIRKKEISRLCLKGTHRFRSLSDKRWYLLNEDVIGNE